MCPVHRTGIPLPHSDKYYIYLVNKHLPSWYLHLVVVGELEYPSDLESYAAGSVATGRVTVGGQVEG